MVLLQAYQLAISRANFRHTPIDTWRNNNVIFTSKQRRFDVIMTSLLRRVPAESMVVLLLPYKRRGALYR